MEGSFWHTGIALYVRQWKRGNLLRKEQEKEQSARKISRCARNDGMGGNGFISRSVQRIYLESATSVTSSRAKSRDLSGILV